MAHVFPITVWGRWKGAIISLRYYFNIKVTLRLLDVKNGTALGVSIPYHFMTIPALSQYSSVPS